MIDNTQGRVVVSVMSLLTGNSYEQRFFYTYGLKPVYSGHCMTKIFLPY